MQSKAMSENGKIARITKIVGYEPRAYATKNDSSLV